MSKPIFFSSKKFSSSAFLFLDILRKVLEFRGAAVAGGWGGWVKTIGDNCVHWKEEALLALARVNFENKGYKLQTQIGRVSDSPDRMEIRKKLPFLL